MNATLTSYNYWPSVLEPHFFENHYLEQEKAKLFYHPDGYVNPKPEPTILTTFLKQGEEDSNISSVGSFDQSHRNSTEVSNNSDVSPEQNSKLRPYKCLQCHKSFLLKHHLTTHQKTHTGERPHVCTHCGKSFTHKYCLNTHLLLHSNERPFYCSECKKRFTLKHHLMSHKRVHRRETPFTCSDCGKSFPLKKQLITHEKFHKGQRPFLCKDCGDSFAKETHLIMHLRFHGSVSAFVCKDCGAAFMRKFELVNHEKLHGKQPLSCPICSKEFLQRRTLVTHLNAHTRKTTHHNEEDISCLHCGNHFQDTDQLNLHQKAVHPNADPPKPSFVVSNLTATKLKPNPRLTGTVKNRKYFCEICFRKFSSKHGLTQHKKRQHGSGSCDNVFTCSFCVKSFGEKDDLLLHQKQHSQPSIVTLSSQD